MPGSSLGSWRYGAWPVAAATRKCDSPRQAAPERGRWSSVDVLVNSACFEETGNFAEVSPDKETEIIDVHIRTLTVLTG